MFHRLIHQKSTVVKENRRKYLMVQLHKMRELTLLREAAGHSRGLLGHCDARLQPHPRGDRVRAPCFVGLFTQKTS
jgi:hypothetical protein